MQGEETMQLKLMKSELVTASVWHGRRCEAWWGEEDETLVRSKGGVRGSGEDAKEHGELESHSHTTLTKHTLNRLRQYE